MEKLNKQYFETKGKHKNNFKKFSWIIWIILFGLAIYYIVKEVQQQSENKLIIPVVNKSVDNDSCLVNDFLKLRDTNLQEDFFVKLDSVIQIQFPIIDRKLEVFVDINPKLLNTFLKDIDIDSFSKNMSYEKEYHFNIAPKGIIDTNICKDKISVSYSKEKCSFKIEVINKFKVPNGSCTNTIVIYDFSIVGNRITKFCRNEAG